MNISSKTLAKLSSLAYNDAQPKLTNFGYDAPNNWQYLCSSGLTNDELGYFGVAFTDGNEVVIAHRGTENPASSTQSFFMTWLSFIKDAFNNAIIAIGDVMPQYDSAIAFHDLVTKNYANELPIIHTGHSLGGALAILTGIYSQSDVIAFDSPGIYATAQDLFSAEQIERTNIKNYASGINMVNTAGRHINDPIGITMPCNNNCHNYIQYTLASHPIDTIIEQFDDTSGEPLNTFAQTPWPSFFDSILMFEETSLAAWRNDSHEIFSA